MSYIASKSIGRTQDTGEKPDLLKAITQEQMADILMAVENDHTNSKWVRDHAIIFLGAALGLRRGEVCLLERNHFRDLENGDTIHIPTLKQSKKIEFVCPNARCGRKCRVKLSSAGKDHKCSKCGTVSAIPESKHGSSAEGVVDLPIDIVEPQTVGFIFDYLDNQMRPDQRYLFESAKDRHISAAHVNRIFSTYATAAGLNPKISFHSLRHSRGVRIFSMFKDLVLCKNALRHKNIATTQIYADLDQEAKDHYRSELAKKAFDPLKKRKRLK